MDYDFPYLGNFMIPTDELSIIFQRGRSTTNQILINGILMHIYIYGRGGG